MRNKTVTLQPWDDRKTGLFTVWASRTNLVCLTQYPYPHKMNIDKLPQVNGQFITGTCQRNFSTRLRCV